MMPRMPQRPFHLSDAILLVAATALGLALCRFLNAHSQVGWRDVWNAFRSPDAANLSLAELWVVAREVARSASPLLLAWSASVLVSRLRGPRPRRRRLWCQPGFLACVAAMLAYGWRLLGFGLFVGPELAAALRRSVTPDVAGLAAELAVLANYGVVGVADAGGAVALAWLGAGAGGRGR